MNPSSCYGTTIHDLEMIAVFIANAALNKGQQHKYQHAQDEVIHRASKVGNETTPDTSILILNIQWCNPHLSAVFFNNRCIMIYCISLELVKDQTCDFQLILKVKAGHIHGQSCLVNLFAREIDANHLALCIQGQTSRCAHLNVSGVFPPAGHAHIAPQG